MDEKMDEASLFMLWALLRRPMTLSKLAAESSLPRATAHRRLREMEERGWVERSSGLWRATDRARAIASWTARDALGVFLVDRLFHRAVRLSVGGWRRALDALSSSGVEFVLAYETAAYVRTGYQTPSAVFAYVRRRDLERIPAGEPARGLADLVLIPVEELPEWEEVSGFRVVTVERLGVELAAWLGRGIVDMAALGMRPPPSAEEVSDVLL